MKPGIFQFILLALFSFSSYSLKSQEITSRGHQEESSNYTEVDKVPVALGCDEQASNAVLKDCFVKSILNHVSQNFNYPKEDRKAGVQGKVYVYFIIEKDARISNVIVTKGVSESLDREALRVIRAFKVTHPAILDGQPVRMSFTLPINAKLDQ